MNLTIVIKKEKSTPEGKPIRKYLLSLFILMRVSAIFAEGTTATWELGKNPLDPTLIKGKIELVDGVVEVDATNTFSLPSTILGEQKDYTIELEFKRPDNEDPGSVTLMSNMDEEKETGLQLIYYPPTYNAVRLKINGYESLERRNVFPNNKNDFVNFTLVVKDGKSAFFKNGLLIDMIGTDIKPSNLPLTFGGMGNNPKKPPLSYKLKNIKVYDRVVEPTGFDPSTKRMRTYSGDGYSIQRAEIKDTTLPRILVVGDSISMGYRGYITEHFKGKAYVDYWVGGSWFAWTVKPDDFPLLRSWDGVFSNGPYDVVTWNAMTLHMWNTNLSRCPEETLKPNMTRVVEHIKKAAPDSRFIWIRCTPWRSLMPDGTSTFDNHINDRIIKYNAIVDEIMKQEDIPEVDLYAVAEKQLHTIKNGSQDFVHWGTENSKLFADVIIKEIEEVLPKHKVENGNNK